MVYGISFDKLLISLRTYQENARADKVIRHLVSRRGTGGGHSSYAGGQIPLDKLSEKAVVRLKSIVVNRFVKDVSSGSVKPQPLAD